MNKQIITASVCLLASLTIAGITGKNFMDVKKPDELRPGPGVTQTKMLSDYFPDIAGTNADSTVYVMEGEQPGGKMLVLGGTHAVFSKTTVWSAANADAAALSALPSGR